MAEVTAERDEHVRTLRRCASLVVSTDGMDEERATKAVGEATFNTPLDKIDDLVNDSFCDLQCRIAVAEADRDSAIARAEAAEAENAAIVLMIEKRLAFHEKLLLDGKQTEMSRGQGLECDLIRRHIRKLIKNTGQPRLDELRLLREFRSEVKQALGHKPEDAMKALAEIIVAWDKAVSLDAPEGKS